jgi:hypothetical protein
MNIVFENVTVCPAGTDVEASGLLQTNLAYVSGNPTLFHGAML